MGVRRVNDIIFSQNAASPRKSKTVLNNDKNTRAKYGVGGDTTTLTDCRSSSGKGGWPCHCTVKNRAPPFGCRSKERSGIAATPEIKTLCMKKLCLPVDTQFHYALLFFLYVRRVLLLLVVQLHTNYSAAGKGLSTTDSTFLFVKRRYAT